MVCCTMFNWGIRPAFRSRCTLVDMFEAIDDDPGDLDWLPVNLKAISDKKRSQRQKLKAKGRYSLTFMPLKQLNFILFTETVHCMEAIN